ncbi:ion transporter [Myroides sp. M-43]|uniref:ion transporter n=1 Tax=Myroides oncorhynchi TaxID=2893756 RepID=UPI001E606C2E|nr:ion transporter [Myroides oncorhynchi]MCC9041990.1 ion transporter [Myroides oncorhynchi]
MNKKTIKYKVYDLLNNDSITLGSKIVQGVIIILILFNAVSLIFESIPEIKEEYARFFINFNLFSVVFFSIEYLLRMWSITCDERFNKPLMGRIKYAFTSMQLIDLCAILPFYLVFVHVDLRILRLMRVFRLLRVFKITRYVSALALVVNVFKRKASELAIAAFMLVFLLLIASTAIYYAENSYQPEAFSSIPDSMWWSVITICTVGYGDIYPITVLGKVIGGILAVIGIGFFALPTGIISSGFTEVLDERKEKRALSTQEVKEKDSLEKCPCCGKPID